MGFTEPQRPMTPNEFRKIALSVPEVTAATRLGNEEFHVHAMPIARLGSPDPMLAVIMLSLRSQAAFVAEAPMAFSPVAGGPGARGATRVRLASAEEDLVRRALEAASRHATAPVRLGKLPFSRV